MDSGWPRTLRRAAAARLGSRTGHDLAQAPPGIRVPALVYTASLDEPELAAQPVRAMPFALFLPLEGLDHPQAFWRSDLVLPDVRGFLVRVREASIASGFISTP